MHAVLEPIDDEFTVQIMSDFYEAVHESSDASLALANVQRDWLSTVLNLLGWLAQEGNPIIRRGT